MTTLFQANFTSYYRAMMTLFQANFTSYYHAMMTLFQVLFGDEWHQLMEDGLIAEPLCTQRFKTLEGVEMNYGDCGSSFAPYFFLIFIIVCNFTMLNLFVGMIINNFSFVHESGDVLVSQCK
ncbi:hypothetical protein T484DRAFT_1776292 [Baffinella frigidus]|nr:hypothetical protein T484DRAFT_1776292 [Cryptophyta sp. CCMP2293]